MRMPHLRMIYLLNLVWVRKLSLCESPTTCTTYAQLLQLHTISAAKIATTCSNTTTTTSTTSTSSASTTSSITSTCIAHATTSVGVGTELLVQVLVLRLLAYVTVSRPELIHKL